MRMGTMGLVWLTAGLLALAACELEPDPMSKAVCNPGEYTCAGTDYVHQCDEDGVWGGRMPFQCVAGECMLADGEPVCM